ncbi:proteoglycan 4-like protein [Cricetulus griseus]|nr:proteoglycan 4-like protein [Cricetulus griseus]
MEWKILPICLSLLLPALLIQQVSSQELSCKGRCFESFARGRECDCDSQCREFGKCCDDYDSFCEEVHNPTSPPPKTAPPPPGASHIIKSTTKRSPKSPKKKTKKVVESEEITEEHSVSENQESSSSSSSSSSTIRKIKSSKNSANRELQKNPKVKDNKKNTPKKEPNPEPRGVDEAGSGLDNGEPKPTPIPASPKTTAAKPASAKPSLAPNSETSKEASSTSNKETTVETKETTATNKQTSASKKEKTTSAKEIRSAENKDVAPTSDVPSPTTSKHSAPTTTKKPVPTTTKEPAPTTTKKPEPAPTTPKEPEATPPKEPAPTTPKKPAPTTPKEPGATTPKTLAEETPGFSEVPIPEVLENDPKEAPVPPTKTPKVREPETTTADKEKTTEKDTPQTTTVAPKRTTIIPEETNKSETSATTKVTPTTTLAPKVTAPTEETSNKPEETTPAAEGVDTKTTLKPHKPTKVPKKPASTKKPHKAPKKHTSTKKPPTSTKKPKAPKRRKPKTTPPPLKTSAMPELNNTPLEVMLPTTTSPNQTPNSEIAGVNLDPEDADGGDRGKRLIPMPPVLSPIVISGTDHLARELNHGININPMLSDEMNLCNGKPVDGLTTLHNGTLVAFRGHYFWMLNPFRPPSPPRRITEVWGIPSPIDTVFTRCNCEGKTFFFKDSQYWRFTNDVQDAGYPKQIVKGFGGLTGKIVAALSVAKYKDRPESVYFFKRGGNIQQYTYKHEPMRKCTGRRPAINYSVYGDTAQVRRRRFERAVGPFQTHTFRIHYSMPMRVAYQDKGFLHNEVKVSTMWRGFPNVVTSAITLPNIRKPDGYDYYAFSKDQYYNIDVPTRTARAVTTRSGQTLSKIWYNCP